MQGVSVRRNPPHGKGTPHIRRITPRPNKSGKSKLNQVARLIRPTRGDFYAPYAVHGGDFIRRTRYRHIEASKYRVQKAFQTALIGSM
ncbi:MAG: hypothetical protein HOP36_05710 [Methyloglobulus sp.]|nr:hypothetical protein [Methyloglobulus sp.]